VAIAFPDFLPHGRRLSRWLGHRVRIVINRVRRLLGMKPLQKVVSLSGTAEASASARGSALVTISDDATDEEKIAFLLRRIHEAQQAVNTLSNRVTDLEEHVPRQLDQLREETRAHVSSELAAAEEEYRPLRIGGTIALAIGLACTTVANFV
jgi:chromosome segregation ATPase